jgi:putative ABC transport system permease protein
MIGLIMFALVVNAAINKNFSSVFLNEDTKGGFDVLVRVNGNNPIPDIHSALGVQGGPNVDQIRAAGEVRVALSTEAEVQNKDRKKNEDGKVLDFSHDTFYGVDQAFLAATTLPMQHRASGYATDRDVWDALAKDPSLAVLSADTTAPANAFGPAQDDILKLNTLSDSFQPFQLQLRDPGTKKLTTITVVGQLKSAGDTFFSLGSQNQGLGGVVIAKPTLLQAFPDSKNQRFYLALKPGTNGKAYAKQVEATLVQASSDSLQKLLDDQQSVQNGFLLVFQGFMGLGLIVGIAALGVVASRAVVERRQQIGMLRAIGYQRGMIALSFLFESGFIALSGILLGLGLGLSLAWVLFTSGNFGPESKGVTFLVPWTELGVVGGLAFVAAMITTYLPARAASRVAVAEALRYE